MAPSSPASSSSDHASADSPPSSVHSAPLAEPSLEPASPKLCPPPPKSASALSNRNAQAKPKAAAGHRRRDNHRDPNQPARPLNSWMIFRSEQLKARRQNGEKLMGAQAKLSQEIAEQWRKISEEERAKYEMMAEECKRKHQELYPDYRYRPRRKVVPVKVEREPPPDNVSRDLARQTASFSISKLAEGTSCAPPRPLQFISAPAPEKSLGKRSADEAEHVDPPAKKGKTEAANEELLPSNAFLHDQSLRLAEMSFPGGEHMMASPQVTDGGAVPIALGLPSFVDPASLSQGICGPSSSHDTSTYMQSSADTLYFGAASTDDVFIQPMMPEQQQTLNFAELPGPDVGYQFPPLRQTIPRNLALASLGYGDNMYDAGSPDGRPHSAPDTNLPEFLGEGEADQPFWMSDSFIRRPSVSAFLQAPRFSQEYDLAEPPMSQAQRRKSSLALFGPWASTHAALLREPSMINFDTEFQRLNGNPTFEEGPRQGGQHPSYASGGFNERALSTMAPPQNTLGCLAPGAPRHRTLSDPANEEEHFSLALPAHGSGPSPYDWRRPAPEAEPFSFATRRRRVSSMAWAAPHQLYQTQPVAALQNLRYPDAGYSAPDFAHYTLDGAGVGAFADAPAPAPTVAATVAVAVAGAAAEPGSPTSVPARNLTALPRPRSTTGADQ